MVQKCRLHSLIRLHKYKSYVLLKLYHQNLASSKFCKYACFTENILLNGIALLVLLLLAVVIPLMFCTFFFKLSWVLLYKLPFPSTTNSTILWYEKKKYHYSTCHLSKFEYNSVSILPVQKFWWGADREKCGPDRVICLAPDQ